MDLNAILAVALASGGLVALVAGLQTRSAGAGDDPTGYLRSLDLELDEADEFTQLLKEPFLTRVVRPLGEGLASGLAALLPSHYRESIHRKLAYAGLGSRVRAEEVITGQLLGVVGGAVLALLLNLVRGGTPGQQLLFLLLLPGAGVLLPQAWLSRKVQERRDTILRDLPDTLDLLAISVEAGVGFEGALAIVCERFDSPLADEFSRTLKEMELGLPRREALQNLKRRTEVPELSNFVLALTQADALGMPIGRVLKTQAAEMRLKRRQWAREKAAKLPVKIMFPLVLFIFPPVFIVVLGPAASQIGGNL